MSYVLSIYILCLQGNYIREESVLNICGLTIFMNNLIIIIIYIIIDKSDFPSKH